MADAILFQFEVNLRFPSFKKGARVFVVHGHDHETKEAVARFLEALGLAPVILHEQPSGGKTIIEKFESHAEADLAIVLLTPDDVGYPQGQEQKARPRPRQNVVFELGFFIGKLGRGRVCALHRGDVEIPSDFNGVIYVQMDDPYEWKSHLAREIKSTGIPILASPWHRRQMAPGRRI